MSIYELFMEICMDLWAHDVSISYDVFKKRTVEYINNLKSGLGTEAHKKIEELGVNDMTGQTWEEQDKNTRKMIKEYEDLLAYLDNDNNWVN